MSGLEEGISEHAYIYLEISPTVFNWAQSQVSVDSTETSVSI